MKSCIVCDAIVEDNAIFCDACGALQDADRKAGTAGNSPQKNEDTDEDELKEEPLSAESPDVQEATPEKKKGAVPSPLDDLMPSPLPNIPNIDAGAFAPPAPIEFASTKPTPTSAGNDTIPEGEGAGSLEDEDIPTPITLEGEGISVDISNSGEGLSEEEDAQTGPVEESIEEIMGVERQRAQAPTTPPSGLSSNQLELGHARATHTRPVLVAVLMGLFFLCLATWFVSKENQAFEKEARAQPVSSAPKVSALGDVTLAVMGTAGAQVTLDGRPVGTLPFTGKIHAGTHVLAVSLKGFETQTKKFTVKKGEKYEVSLTLIEVASGMTWVSPGPFFRGCDLEKDPFCQRYRSEQPGRDIDIDGFYIDKTEVTVGQYEACVKAGICSGKGLNNYTGPVNRQGVPSYLYSEMCNWAQKGRDQHPLNCVTWYEGEQYCQWQKKHLPTEAQWEKAARGTAATLYPWGNAEPSCHFAVIKIGSNACSQKQTWPVASKPEGQSPFGLMDMVGNVSEWVWDRFSAGYYAQAPSKNPIGPGAGFQRGIRGGAWSSVHTSGELRTSYRWRRPPTFRSLAIGFRCAKPGPGAAEIIPQMAAEQPNTTRPSKANPSPQLVPKAPSRPVSP